MFAASPTAYMTIWAIKKEFNSYIIHYWQKTREAIFDWISLTFLNFFAEIISQKKMSWKIFLEKIPMQLTKQKHPKKKIEIINCKHMDVDVYFTSKMIACKRRDSNVRCILLRKNKKIKMVQKGTSCQTSHRWCTTPMQKWNF